MITEPNINKDNLIRILSENYDIEIVQLTFIPKGEVSWGYIVQSKNEDKYFLKIHKAKNLTPQRFNLLNNLHTKAKINNIAYPIPTKTNQLEIMIDGYQSVLFNFIDGKSVHEQGLNDEQYEQLGELLAQIHQSPKIIEEYSFKETFDIPQKDEFIRVMASVKNKPNYKDSVRQQAQKLFFDFKEKIYKELQVLQVLSKSLKQADIKYVLCHGEPSPGNIMITSGNQVFLIDWDEPIMAPKEKDLLFFNNHLQPILKGYAKYSSDTVINKEIKEFYSHLWNVAEITDWGSRLFLSQTSEEELKHSLEQLKNFFNYSGLGKDSLSL